MEEASGILLPGAEVGSIRDQLKRAKFVPVEPLKQEKEREEEKSLDRGEKEDKNKWTETKEKLLEPKKVVVVLSTFYPHRQSVSDAELTRSADIMEQIYDIRSGNELTEDEKKLETEVSDTLRASLALRTIDNLIKLGVSVVLVDGGSNEEFIEDVERRRRQLNPKGSGTLVVERQVSDGYSQGRREGINAAVEVLKKRNISDGVVGQIEPEKVSITDPNVLAGLVNPVLRGDKKVMLLDRWPECNMPVPEDKAEWSRQIEGVNYGGYPPYQFNSERWLNERFNQVASEVSGKPVKLDWLNGTRFISQNEASLFTQIVSMTDGNTDPERYFNAVYFPILDMIAQGEILQIGSYAYKKESSFYPPMQSKLEVQSIGFNKKRDRQREQLSAELAAWKNYWGDQKNKKEEVEILSGAGKGLREYLFDSEISPEYRVPGAKYRWETATIVDSRDITYPGAVLLCRLEGSELWQKNSVVAAISPKELPYANKLDNALALNLRDTTEDEVDGVFAMLKNYLRVNTTKKLKIYIESGHYLPGKVLKKYEKLFNKVDIKYLDSLNSKSEDEYDLSKSIRKPPIYGNELTRWAKNFMVVESSRWHPKVLWGARRLWSDE